MAQSSKTIKRILHELSVIQKGESDSFHAYALEDNIFQWHFTIRGPADSPYENGYYHGKVVLTKEYPFEPPDVYFFTESGRFDTRMKICLSVTSYHPEHWCASYTIPMILEGIRAYMREPGKGSIGNLDYSTKERITLAQESHSYSCKICTQNVCDHIALFNARREPSKVTSNEESQSEDEKVQNASSELVAEPVHIINSPLTKAAETPVQQHISHTKNSLLDTLIKWVTACACTLILYRIVALLG